MKTSLIERQCDLKCATEKYVNLLAEKEKYNNDVAICQTSKTLCQKKYDNAKQFKNRLFKALNFCNLIFLIILIFLHGITSIKPYAICGTIIAFLMIVKILSSRILEGNHLKELQNIEEQLQSLFRSEHNKEYESLISSSQSEISNIKEQIDELNILCNSASSFLTNVYKLNNRRAIISDETILNFIFHHNKSFGQRLPLTELFEKLANYSNCYAQTVSISQNELILYRQLVAHASRMGLAVSFQMRLSDIIDLGDVSKYSGTSMEQVQGKYRDFLRNRHVDFALISVNDGRCKLCIELDDSSHYDISNPRCTNQTMYNHVIKDLLLSYCGVPLLRLDKNNYPNLASMISNSMSNKCTTYHYTDENLIRFHNALNSYSHNPKD